MTPSTAEPRIACVGGIVVVAGQILLVQRGQEPALGLWSIPGGRLLDGEPLAAGAEREVLEETGLRVRAGAVVGRVERLAPGGGIYVIDDLACVLVDDDGGSDPAPQPVAGDDAADAAWFDRAALEALDASGRMADGVLDALRAWSVLDELR